MFSLVAAELFYPTGVLCTQSQTSLSCLSPNVKSHTYLSEEQQIVNTLQATLYLLCGTFLFHSI